MKRLTNTKLFLILENRDVVDFSCKDIRLVYDEFVQSVVSLCSLDKWNVLTYFTMHYTLIELERLQILLENEGKKNDSILNCISHCLAFLSVALQLDLVSNQNLFKSY